MSRLTMQSLAHGTHVSNYSVESILQLPLTAKDGLSEYKTEGNSTMDVRLCLNCTVSSAKMLDVFKKNQTVVNSSLMFASGLLGNILALLVLARSPVSQRQTIFYRLVAGLVITDLTGTTSTSPIVIAVYVNNFKWIGGDGLCQYFAFMMEFAGATTVFIICAMSIERYLCIRHPYFYHTRLSPGHALNLLAVAWAIGIVLAVLPLMGVGKNILKFPRTWCFFDYYSPRIQDKVYCYLFGLLGVLSISITVTCNVIVMYTLVQGGCKQKILNNKTSTIHTSSRRNRYAELEMLVLLTVFTVTFATCWAPLVVRVIINQTGSWPQNESIDLLVIRLASINQILDPWVYILMKRELLWKIVSLVKAFCCRRSDKLQSCDHATVVTGRKREFLQRAEEPSCMSVCRGCVCDPPDTKPCVGKESPFQTRPCVGNDSPFHTRRHHINSSTGSLHFELTPLCHTRNTDGTLTSVPSQLV